MTQNEKDRKIVNQALVVCKIALGTGVDEDAPMIQAIRIADKLLTERENAEEGYLHDASKVGYQDACSTRFINNKENYNGNPGIKGVWIAIKDGEEE
ncbi:hypothetical protein [Listeria rocourtiae]|uniref:hypothetical protein n=1 Tax=Listeria rocourtiae TaxID=647910 RepID=UPI0003E86AD6|nr:hypothetical protein [Listeria rocourtiae]EUJ51817.1 hypothetical protein PROCOU_01562 [Listeria rocourtiae FSL F6-920]